MADFYDVTAMLTERLRSAWTATPADRLRFENEAPIDMTDLAPFCQVEIAGGPAYAYMGHTSNRLRRMDGVMMLHFMTPMHEGVSAIQAMHRNARNALADTSWKRTAYTVDLEWEDDDWWDGRDIVFLYMQGMSATGDRPATEDGSYYGATASIGFFAIYLNTP